MSENHTECLRLGSSANNKWQHPVLWVFYFLCVFVCMHFYCNLVEIIKGRGREVG